MISASYIDDQLFVTNLFNPSHGGVQVYDDNLSAERMNYVLSQHYYQTQFYLSTNLFTDSVASPRLNFRLQDQINQLLNGKILIIENLLDFEIQHNTFVNPYSQTLSYSANFLPLWMIFDSNKLRFYGTPTFNDRDNDYNISLVADNGFQQITDFFIFKTAYYKPSLLKSLQSQIHSTPQVELETTYFFSKDSFSDPNNGTLTYAATLNGLILPSWIIFDESNLMLDLNPDDSVLLETFTINITASNRHFSISDSITFEVQASYKYILTLMSQILAGLLTIIGYLRYRTTIYNMIFKKFYIYPDEIIYTNNMYRKDIYFIKEDLDIAYDLWMYVKKQAKFKEIFNENLLLDLDFKVTLSKEITNAYDALLMTKKIKEFVNIAVLQPEGTIFVICECFFYHCLLLNSKKKAELFKKMKVQMIKEESKLWYLNYVEFDQEERDLLIKKFPKVRVDTEKLKARYEKALNLMKVDESFVSYPLICGLVKADALGIPESKRKAYQNVEFSRGESCFLDILSVNEIRFRRILLGSKQDLEVNSTKKLPSWLDYHIKNGILNLFGTPKYYDQGGFNISIIDRNGFVLRSQNIEIKAAGAFETTDKLPGKMFSSEVFEKMIDCEIPNELEIQQAHFKKSNF